ncbi:MAG TPA: tRNA pseudouridine(55) synthase TruB [Thiothrix sp.]|nr:tRNA pseudouridine(55) synthase TruB [Thiothrix sp.]
MARRRKGRAISGILLLDKPLGISSNRALQNAKHQYQAQKAGHTGSLDPLATGMLPICFGEATKISSFLLDSDKTYLTTATLGKTTTTGDAEGEVLAEKAVPPLDEAKIESILSHYRGSITQIPPMYSALKHQGKPLYELARQGIEIERKQRHVTIHQLELLSFTDTTLELKVECSKGTYIRTLVEDIGNSLGCGAFVSMLHRTQVNPFDNKDMISWDAVETLEGNDLDNLLLPIDSGLSQFPEITLDDKQSVALLHGQAIQIAVPDASYIRIYNQKRVFLGMGIPDGDNVLKPKRIMQYQ